MKKNLLFIFSLLFLYCCGQREERGNGEGSMKIQTYKLSLHDHYADLLSEVVDHVSFLKIEEDEHAFFSSINKLIIKNGQIYLFDRLGSNSLFTFNEDSGTFKRRIGSKGHGPQEYVRLWDFEVDSATIYMYDRAKLHLFRYNLAGDLLEVRKMPFRADAFKVLGNEKYLFSLVKESNKSRVVLTDKNFKVEKTFFTYNEDDMDDKITDNIFQEAGDVIYYNKPINDTIYMFSKSGECLGGFHFDFGQYSLPEGMKNSYTAVKEEINRHEYMYFYDCPFVVNKMWIGAVFYGNSKATLLYDTRSNRHGVKKWESGKLNYTDIYLPLFADDKRIVGWMDIDVYESLKNKPDLDEAMIQHMKDGGRILCLYYLRR